MSQTVEEECRTILSVFQNTIVSHLTILLCSRLNKYPKIGRYWYNMNVPVLGHGSNMRLKANFISAKG